MTDREPPTGCPCCTDRDVDELVDLCEDCLTAHLDGGCHHADPLSGIDILQAAPTQVLRIDPVRHQAGRAWHWKAAMDAHAAGCARCRPGVPCWRHDAPVVELVDPPRYDPAIPIWTCVMAAERWAADTCTGGGGITVEQAEGAGMVSSVCPSCAVAYLGPVLDAEAVTRA